MIDERLVENWAGAILNVAKEQKKISVFLAQSNVIIQVLKDYPDYIRLLSNQKISKDDRKEMIDKAFGRALDKTLVNIFKLLIDRERFSAVRLIFKQLRKYVNELNHIQYGNVYSIELLSAGEMQTIKEKISKRLNQEVELVNKIDPTLIGGVRVKVKNQIFDGSIRGKLNSMRDMALKNRGE